MQQLPIPGLVIRFQEQFSDELFYSGKTIREVILKHFPLVDGRLEGILIFTNKAQNWFEDIPQERLVVHVPDLKHEAMKRYLLLANPKLYSKVTNRLPPEAYKYFGISIAEKANSGVITTFDATANGYKPIGRDQQRQLLKI